MKKRKWLIPLATMERQIKTTAGYHLNPVTMTECNKHWLTIFQRFILFAYLKDSNSSKDTQIKRWLDKKRDLQPANWPLRWLLWLGMSQAEALSLQFHPALLMVSRGLTAWKIFWDLLAQNWIWSETASTQTYIPLWDADITGNSLIYCTKHRTQKGNASTKW